MSSATTTARPNVSAQARPPQARQSRERIVAAGLEPVDIDIERAARTLHLPTIRDGYEEAVESALRDRSTYKQFLADLLGGEVAHREERRKLRLVREANFSRPKRIEDFDYSSNPNISPEQINTSATPAGSTPGSRSASSATAAPANHTCSSASAPRSPRPDSRSATPPRRTWSTNSPRPPTTGN